MSSQFKFSSLAVMLASALSCGILVAADDAKDGFIDTFNVKPADFAFTGRNDYFILEPGHQHIFEGDEDGKPGRLLISVLDDTKVVDGVETRVVEERESSDGKLVEVSRNYFAIDKTTNNVYYFGEEVDVYKDGKIDSHPGSWESGKDGAHYGLFIPAKPAVGQKYYQEIAPKVAMDRFEVMSISEKLKVPAGEFENCIKTRETTPLEPDDIAYKLYAPGVGLLVDGQLKLVKHGTKLEPRADRNAPNGNAPGGNALTGDPAAIQPVVPLPIAREALSYVGADPDAEAIWVEAINDKNLTANQRQDLIEDLNEDGFADPDHVTPEELPLVLNRLLLIEDLAPDAMDEVNAAAFAEAYKDLSNMAVELLGQ